MQQLYHTERAFCLTAFPLFLLCHWCSMHSLGGKVCTALLVRLQSCINRTDLKKQFGNPYCIKKVEDLPLLIRNSIAYGEKQLSMLPLLAKPLAVGKFNTLFTLVEKTNASSWATCCDGIKYHIYLIVIKVLHSIYLCKNLFVLLPYVSWGGKGKHLWQVNMGWLHLWEGKANYNNNLTGWMLLVERMNCSMEMRGKAFTNLVTFSSEFL